MRTAAASTPSGTAHGGELGQPVALGGEQLEAHLLQAVVQQPAGLGVPGVDGVQPLLEDPAEPGVQRDDHAGGRGVVVGAPAEPAASPA